LLLSDRFERGRFALLVYLVIGGIGFLLLVITWFVGELFDVGHDVAGFFGDHLSSFDVDGHHVEVGHHGDVGEAGPSPFSSRVIFTFMTAFGGGGSIASLYGLSVIPSAMVAIGSGLVLGSATYAMARVIWRQSSSSAVEVSQLVGRTARVVVRISGAEAGQVTLAAGGGTTTLLARSRTGETIAEGSQVKIHEVEGDVLVVESERDPGRQG
jgi:membrane protein implicated in regulation of membrane protease activity